MTWPSVQATVRSASSWTRSGGDQPAPAVSIGLGPTVQSSVGAVDVAVVAGRGRRPPAAPVAQPAVVEQFQVLGLHGQADLLGDLVDRGQEVAGVLVQGAPGGWDDAHRRQGTLDQQGAVVVVVQEDAHAGPAARLRVRHWHSRVFDSRVFSGAHASHGLRTWSPGT